jgi:hypothetical protein
MLHRLHKVVELLPSGLLMRLLADAEFYHAWNLGKRRARGHGRMLQFENWKKKEEDKYWRNLNR